MTETQQRFLRSIAERVPKEQVVEVHLFPPIRQGGVETGVAVVAEDPRPHVPARIEPIEVLADEVVEAAPVDDASLETVVDVAVDPFDDLPASEDVYADDPADVELDATDDTEPAPNANGNGHAPKPAHERLIIHTARYRLTLKGVDRGKWEVDVVAEADAPLDAIDAVIRGVQRRSPEGAEPDRLTTDAFREALEAPLATLER